MSVQGELFRTAVERRRAAGAYRGGAPEFLGRERPGLVPELGEFGLDVLRGLRKEYREKGLENVDNIDISRL